MADETKEGEVLDFTDTPAETEAENVETVVESEDQNGNQEPEQVKQPEADTEPKFDKVRQQVQQELGNFRRQLLAELQASRPAPAATEKPKQDDPLDKIVGDTLADESDKVLAQEVRRLRQELEEERNLTKRERQEYQAELSRVRAEQERRAFREANPDLADNYDTLVAKAREEIDAIDDFDQWPAKAREAYAARVWRDVVASAAQKPAPSAPPKPQTKPDKDARGAQLTKGTPKTTAAKATKTPDELAEEGFFE